MPKEDSKSSLSEDAQAQLPYATPRARSPWAPCLDGGRSSGARKLRRGDEERVGAIGIAAVQRLDDPGGSTRFPCARPSIDA
jgi:hypothetical protein